MAATVIGLIATPLPARRRGRWWIALGPAALGALVMVTALLGFVFAITDGGLGCTASDAGGPGPAGPAPSRSALTDIPPAYLRLYQQAGRRYDIDWTFLASIGAQETDHGRAPGSFTVNYAGAAGPMQICVGACGHEWQQYGVDGNGDGRKDVMNPADAIPGAARILREQKGAPSTGGSYQAYRQAACRYYGACADASANYADEVMARAVQYGFHGQGSPPPSSPAQAHPVAAATSSGCQAGSAGQVTDGSLGQVRRLTAPRRLAPLPPSAVVGGRAMQCDARIVPDVEYLTRRFQVRVTACYAIHSLDGEHPLGAATDLVPADGNWNHTLQLAHAIGWKESCAASGVAPACARPPFRFIGYNGFPNHGDPTHCVPCSGGAHLHVSWLTSASLGEPENQPRTTYFASSWIDVFITAAGGRGA
jgi:hypothetical protein